MPMRFTKFFALALGVAFLVVWSANGQPPPGEPKGDKGFKGQKGLNTNCDRLVDGIKLTDAQRTKARDSLRAHDDKMRQTMRQARTELLAQMKDVLPEEDYKTFKDELDQVPLLPSIPAILQTVSADDLVTRLMSYDKNGDGKVTKDELPERMHSLIEQGDRNGDGALDRDEIRRLGEQRAGPGGPGGPGPKGGPKGAKGPPPKLP